MPEEAVNPAPGDRSRLIADHVDDLLGTDAWSSETRDVLSVVPDLTVEDAYALQFAQMARRVERGARIVGYKASNTSLGAQQVLNPESPVPTVGTLLASSELRDGQKYTIRAGKTFIEAEVVVVMASSLRGGHVTRIDAARAVGSVCPAMEIAAWSPAMASGQVSLQHSVATHKTNGGFIIGAPIPLDAVDNLHLEGVLLETNDEIVGSRTAVEAMGHPLDVVVAVAKTLHRHGLGLEAGMVVMTGSLLPPFIRPIGVTWARASFTRLGSVSVRFDDSAAPEEGRP